MAREGVMVHESSNVIGVEQRWLICNEKEKKGEL